ncbi:Acetylxylan esterase A [Podospora aff. communis PSN243]|uniref:Carboxylic ester hydrolase n=1 Tax=Podospora aff. communis PSN243 TaxID=3040156 RepID=A0AAV9G6D8_9PEZI|nr:Acetylxylan esterase A [Podospora aff. communis PSN243]
MKLPFAALLGASVVTAQLQPITTFGVNKSGARMFIYEPKNLPANPAIVVGIHYCTGSAQRYYNSNPGLHQLADQKRFLVIYPESPNEGGCWDVSSRATLKRDGGADSNSIAEMVRWTLDKYQADKSRVFIVGESSGGMMASILAAAYPDLFTAVINYSGVAAGCFFTDSVAGWNSTCAQGRINATPEWWAKWVWDAYPGYNGTRPRMQLYHGDVDATIAPANYNYSVAQWRTVFGYGEKPVGEKADTPERGYTTQVFGELLTGVYAKGVGHGVPVHPEEDMKFFGL